MYIKDYNSNFHNRNTRYKNNLRIPRLGTVIFERQEDYSAIKIYNKSDREFKEIPHKKFDIKVKE